MNRCIRTFSRMRRWLVGPRIAAGVCSAPVSSVTAEETALPPVLEIKIGYRHRAPSKAKLSLLDIAADNDGVAVLQLAVDDSNTTGQFRGQKFVVVDKLLKSR